MRSILAVLAAVALGLGVAATPFASPVLGLAAAALLVPLALVLGAARLLRPAPVPPRRKGTGRATAKRAGASRKPATAPRRRGAARAR